MDVLPVQIQRVHTPGELLGLELDATIGRDGWP
jgi:hypothetical protein